MKRAVRVGLIVGLCLVLGTLHVYVVIRATAKVVAKPLDKRFGDIHDVRDWCAAITVPGVPSTAQGIIDWLEKGYAYTPDSIARLTVQDQQEIQNIGDFYNFPGETLTLRTQADGGTWSADCEDMTFLFWSLCAGKGIPCRCLFGAAVTDGVAYGHAINQVWVDGRWYYVDCIASGLPGGKTVLLANKPSKFTTYWWTDGSQVVENVFGGGQELPGQMDVAAAHSWVQELGR